MTLGTKYGKYSELKLLAENEDLNYLLRLQIAFHDFIERKIIDYCINLWQKENPEQPLRLQTIVYFSDIDNCYEYLVKLKERENEYRT